MLSRIWSEKDNSVWMVWDTYDFITLFTNRTQNSMYKWLRMFLNKNNIEIILGFEY